MQGKKLITDRKQVERTRLADAAVPVWEL